MALVACVTTDEQAPTTDPNTSDAVASTNNCLPALPADSEYGFYAGKGRIITFTGFYSDQAETFFIWNLGTTIQHGAPYPDPSHGTLYGVFTPQPCGSVHHVAGQDQWDHYHILTQGVGTRTYDVKLVFPGPNFNASNYQPPKDEQDLQSAQASGKLGATLLTTDAGFGPLVITVPET